MTSSEADSCAVGKQRERLPSSFIAFKNEDLNFPREQLKDTVILKTSSVGKFSSLQKAYYFGRKVAIKTLTFEENHEHYAFVELALLKNISRIHRENMEETEIYAGDYRNALPFQHHHILDFIGAFSYMGRLHLVTEFLDRGDLKKALRPDLQFFKRDINPRDLDLNWKQRLRAVKHITCALKDLHSFDIMHRDIKTENIFFTGRGRKTVFKLGDFGFARKVEDSEPRTMTLCGTEELMAPELLLGLNYDRSADVYALGLVIAEIICGRGPTPMSQDLSLPAEERELQNFGGDFLKRTPRESFDVDFEEIRKYTLAGCPLELIDLCSDCLIYEPINRIKSDYLHSAVLQLEEDCDAHGAERLPSKVPHSLWAFDHRKGQFMHNSHRNNDLHSKSNLFDLVEPATGRSSDQREPTSPKASATVVLSANGKQLRRTLNGPNGQYVVKAAHDPKVSKHSESGSVLNLARRQLREVTRKLGILSTGETEKSDLARVSSNQSDNSSAAASGLPKTQMSRADATLKRLSLRPPQQRGRRVRLLTQKLEIDKDRTGVPPPRPDLEESF